MKGLSVPVHGLLNFKPETIIPVWLGQFDCQIQKLHLFAMEFFAVNEWDGKQDSG